MITDQELINYSQDSYSVSDLMKKVGLHPTGSNHKSFKKRIKNLGLTFKIRPINNTKSRPVNDYLFKNGPSIGSSRLRHKLIKFGLKQNNCEQCGINSWNNKPLSLHLDHIDGDNTNNQLSNLRILCPNCHSQTETYARIKGPLPSRLKTIKCCKLNQGKVNIEDNGKRICSKCSTVITRKSKSGLCKKCQSFLTRRVVRPSYEELLHELTNNSYVKIAEKYGVSDKTIVKWIKAYTLIGRAGSTPAESNLA